MTHAGARVTVRMRVRVRMNKDRPMWLFINTPDLWRQCTFRVKDDPGAESLEFEDLWENGIRLKQCPAYFNANETITLDHPFTDLAIDRCGLVYFIDESSKSVSIFDREDGTYRHLDQPPLNDPKHLSVSDDDLYVLDGDTLICFALVNYQLRWQKSGVSEVADMCIGHQGHLYMLKNDGLVKAWTRKTGYALEFDVQDVKIENNMGPGARHAIASHKKGLSILSTDPKSLSYVIERIDLDEDLIPGRVVQPPTILPLPKEATYTTLAVDGQGTMYLGHKGGRDISLIKLEERLIPRAVVVTTPLDSTRQGCQWHRVVLDMDLPDNTRVEVSYSASEDRLAGPENYQWSSPALTNTLDALILDARGRFIAFKISLYGDALGKKSPCIRSIKAEFPHHSYLRYLPAVYQEDEKGREFLRRFLPLFESVLNDLEECIISIPRYFDPEAAPDEFLPWLGDWLALSYDENWNSTQLRQLIQKAPHLYRHRGTRHGIEEVINLYTGGDEFSQGLETSVMACMPAGGCRDEYLQFAGQPMIILENNILWHAGSICPCRECTGKECECKDTVKECAFRDYEPFCFCVLLKPFSVPQDKHKTVERIVRTEKPAHTEGHVKFLEPWFHLCGFTFLGINTMLSEPAFVLGESALARDTVAADREGSGQVNVRSRLGDDTVLT